MSQKCSFAFLTALLLGLTGTASAEMTYYLGIYNDTDYYVMVDIPAKKNISATKHCTILIGGAEKDGSYKIKLEPKSRDRKVVTFRRHGGRCDGKQGHLEISAVADSNEYHKKRFRDWQHFWYSNSGGFAKHGRNSQYKSKLERTPGVAGRGNYDLRITDVIALAGGKRSAATTNPPAKPGTANLNRPKVKQNGAQVIVDVNGHIQNAKGKTARLVLEFFEKKNSKWIILQPNTAYQDGSGRAAETQRPVPIPSNSYPLKIENLTIPKGAFEQLKAGQRHRLRVKATLYVGKDEIDTSPLVEVDFYRQY